MGALGRIGGARRAMGGEALREGRRARGLRAAVRIVTELEVLADGSFLIEAVAEEVDCKAPLLARLGAMTGPEEILATTTSSLSIAELADVSGHPDRLLGLHVFNPVPRMPLVELVCAPTIRDELRRRARELCAALNKTAVEVPDTPGFVVTASCSPTCSTRCASWAAPDSPPKRSTAA